MLSLKLIVASIAILIVVYLASLSFLTRQAELKADGERHLRPCPGKPNCIFSQSADKEHALQAFAYIENDYSKSWDKLMSSIQQSGGEILINDGRYCHAVFTSKLFRFKDDLEAEINDTQIDIRSASRAGTSDFGQNRKRVEQIRQRYLMPDS